MGSGAMLWLCLVLWQEQAFSWLSGSLITDG